MLFGKNYDNIYIIKDEDGNLLWHEMNQYDIRNFKPGKSYEIISSTSFDFSYPSNNNFIDSVSEINSNIFEKYYSSENTGQNMSLGIRNSAWSQVPEVGDEIAAFNSDGLVVGSAIYNGGNIGFSLWGNSATDSEIKALIDNEVFKLKLWHRSNGFEDEILVHDWEQGDSLYSNNKIAIISSLELIQNSEERDLGFQLFSDFVNQQYSISVSVKELSYVELNIYNQSGQFVKNIISDKLSIGKHNFEFDFQFLTSGIYYFILYGNDTKIIKKLPILK